MIQTLRGRLGLTYALLTIGLVILLGAALLALMREFYVDQLTAKLEDEARFVAAALDPALTSNPTLEQIDPLVETLGAEFDGRISVISTDGRLLGDSSGAALTLNPFQEPEVQRVVTQGATVSSHQTQDSLAIALSPVGQPTIVVRIAVPLGAVNGELQRVQRDVFGFALAAAALVVAVAIFVSGRITRPIDALRRHAAEVSTGNLDVTTPPVAPREIGDLARSFNSMTARIRDAMLDAERSRARLQALYTNLSDGVVMVDERGLILGLNDAASEMLMANPIWVVGHPFVIAARDHDLVRLMERSFAGTGAATATIEYTRGGRIIEATSQVVAGSNERFGIVILRDISDLRRLESVRREFVANVSHELRTPLASIRAVVETLEAGAIDDPEVASDFLGRIVGETDRLATLVDELLELARLESGRLALKPERISAARLVIGGAERLRPQTERARLKLKIEVPSSLPEVTVDRTRIEQVLINLIHNAIKFTPPDGEITVRAGVQADTLVISVTDTGIGIPESELPRVFERFYKADRARRSEGTGLGLAIAKHIVQAHHGTIAATSEPGQGATFTVTLPIGAASETLQLLPHDEPIRMS